MHKCYPFNDCLEVVSMSSYLRPSSTIPFLLGFLMVTMAWSSVLDNRHDAQTETTLSDIVISHAGWSSPTTLDSTDSVGYQSSLAIDSNDHLHVTYRDTTNGNLEYMAYDGSSWSTPVSLDSTDNVGYQSSLAIDSNDNLHATYYDATNQNLEYTTYDGSSWSTPISLDSTDSVGYDSSLAIDSNDNLHVTYLDYTNGNLEYMTFDGSSWSTPVSLDSTDRVGWDSSLAIDSNDHLHVTYLDETNYNLEYMAYDGSSWSTPVSIDSTDRVGWSPSLAIDSNDNLHVTYLDETNWNLEYMTYDGSSWSTPVSLDSTDIVGSESSLAIDSNDNLHVTYYDNTNYNLEYMTYNGSSWGTPVSLDSTGNVGLYCSLAIDSNDNLHVTYFDAPNGNLEYVTYSTPMPPVISYSPSDFILTNNTAMSTLSPTSSGGDVVTWSIDPALSSGLLFNSTNGEISGIPDVLSVLTVYTISAINTDGSFNTSINITIVDVIPVISYSPSEFNLTNNTTMSPTTVPVNTGGPIPSGANTTVTQFGVVDAGGDVGEYSSFVLDSTGSKHISYYDATNGDLKYATDTTGSWVNSTIDSNGNVGQYSSITVDSNDVIHISYYDESNGDLMYITDRSGSWVNTTIDSTGALGIGDSVVGLYTSIAIDSNAKVHISYLHSNSSVQASYLKYATDTTGSWVTETAFNTTSNGLIRAGHYSSIALDSNDKVHISAYDGVNRDLIHVTNKNGSWVKTTVQYFADVGLYTSLAIDSNDDLHIAYHAGIYSSVGENLRYAMYNGSTGWTSIEIDTLGSVGSFASLALDSNGFVHISYYDETNQQLKYATNLNGSWELSEIDSVGNVGSHTSISVDTNGAVDISYYDEMNGNLLHSRLDSSYNVYRFTVSPDLPIGLELNITTGEISGTPTAVSPLATYSVTATNTGGSFTTSINITVNAVAPTLAYSPDRLVLTNNTAMSTLSPTTSGGEIVTWSIDPEPSSGLLFNMANGEISGIPDALSILTVYTISATNTGGTVTATVNITVNAVTSVMSYAPDSLVLTNNTAMSTLSPTTSGGEIVTWSIDPEPSSGLLFNTTNGEISGIPDALSVLTVYTISATNTGGTVTATVNITVNAEMAVISYSPSNLTLIRNLSMPTLSPTVAGGAVVSWEISPELPSGLQFGPSNGSVWGASLANMSQIQYTVWANNTGGSAEALLNITALEPVAVIGYSPDSLTLTRTQPMTPWIPGATGGQVETWEIEPTLPLGLSFSNGVISGTPEVNMTLESYTIWANNSGGASSANITLLIHEPIPQVSYSPDNIVLTRGQNMTLITASLGEGMVSIWEISPSLPDGLVFENGGISGTPVVNFTMTQYSVIAQNSGGSFTVLFNLTVVEPVAILSIESNQSTLLRDNSSLALNITNDGGMVQVWEVYPSLPDGLLMENGSVSGVSLVNQSETIFTIWGNNSGGSNSVTFTLTVQEPEITIVEQLPEQEPEVSINLFILSLIFVVPLLALIIVFRKHHELMS